MSTADALIAKGIEKGLQRGLIQAPRDYVIEALEIRFGVVPDSIREAVAAVWCLDKLDTLHKIALFCPRAADFVEDQRRV